VFPLTSMSSVPGPGALESGASSILVSPSSPLGTWTPELEGYWGPGSSSLGVSIAGEDELAPKLVCVDSAAGATLLISSKETPSTSSNKTSVLLLVAPGWRSGPVARDPEEDAVAVYFGTWWYRGLVRASWLIWSTSYLWYSQSCDQLACADL
jgi:hypothetical protein